MRRGARWWLHVASGLFTGAAVPHPRFGIFLHPHMPAPTWQSGVSYFRSLIIRVLLGFESWCAKKRRLGCDLRPTIIGTSLRHESPLLARPAGMSGHPLE
mmetsp:Transcript_27861/g.52014  ORF Transcript_27861/g.52014 Transcript_27861/m.52014 type:complete len:100 (+) Transcript_27861:218-517(+)